MPPSQLKQLKASLHEHGVVGPQKSKKQRKANSKDAGKRLQRNAALESIRERFNPFETKTSARPQKYAVVTNKEVKAPVGRPGVTRGLGEERRRETLLREIQSRNKVGGLLDKRFGEDDPNLTPEQKVAERFARQNERKLRKTSMFNLEDDDDEGLTLTHGGRSLDFAESVKDDYEQDEVDQASQDFEAQDDRPRKRVRLDDEDEAAPEEEAMLPERRKSKKEVMQEVIAKSKAYKAERQAAKEDDEDLRMELDQGMLEMYDVLRSNKPPERALPTPPSESEPVMDPSRAAMLAGKSREEAEKEYEHNVRQMKLDARSKPAFRTKTEEEKAAAEAERLQELERQRERRMKGEAGTSEDEQDEEVGADGDQEQDDAELFGLNQPEVYAPRKELDVEDEDEFVLDDDLVASGSEVDMASDDEDSAEETDAEDDGDDDFINGLGLPPSSKTSIGKEQMTSSSNLAYTYSCPETHEEFLHMLQGKESSDLPVIVQRIRALYHKGLAEDNLEKLGRFAHVLLRHTIYAVDETENVQLMIVESLLRHLHSMAKSQSNDVASAYRSHLTKIADERPLQLTAGDLTVLTGISTTFPTSDHFHPVVTPAMLTLARYLGQSSVQSLQDLAIGSYACSLALQYQGFAKRYVSEVVTYIVNAFAILSPSPLKERVGIAVGLGEGRPLNVPIRLPEKPLRIKISGEGTVDHMSFSYLLPSSSTPSTLAMTLLNTFINLTEAASTLWSSKSAYPEIATPLIHCLHHITVQDALPAHTLTLASTAFTKLTDTRNNAIKARRPLLLHNHRPLAIKSSHPQFIDSYNPRLHYDPDRQRADLAKLRSEHKKERKGAMRELRKDANFVAREQLREKKEKDEAYDKKFKRLVAEIQGEEGRESKEYERERKKRKGKA